MRGAIPNWRSTPTLQYSHTPILHHSAWPDSRTRTTTRTRTKRLVRADHVFYRYPGLKARAESFYPFGIVRHAPRVAGYFAPDGFCASFAQESLSVTVRLKTRCSDVLSLSRTK